MLWLKLFQETVSYTISSSPFFCTCSFICLFLSSPFSFFFFFFFWHRIALKAIVEFHRKKNCRRMTQFIVAKYVFLSRMYVARLRDRTGIRPSVYFWFIIVLDPRRFSEQRDETCYLVGERGSKRDKSLFLFYFVLGLKKILCLRKNILCTNMLLSVRRPRACVRATVCVCICGWLKDGSFLCRFVRALSASVNIYW